MRALRTRRRLALPILVAAALAIGSAGSAEATFPGANGRIAFSDYITNQVYAVNPDGTGLVQLTHVPGRHAAFGASWSPDGAHVAFASNEGGPWRLRIVAADGSGVHRVAGDRAGVDDFVPTYTPDGRRLVFTRCRPDPPGGCALFSIRTNGTARRALTPYRRDVVDFLPSVSPDGRWIAFTRFGANGITVQVYVMRADGSAAHPVTPPRLEGARPDWAPDGDSITFSSDWNRLGGDIYVMKPDGANLHRLTDASVPNNNFSSGYSPDGRFITFASDRRYDDFCCSDLFMMAADGSYESRIVMRNKGVIYPAWGTAPLVHVGAAAGPAISSGRDGRAKQEHRVLCQALLRVISGRLCGGR
jgi:Tol biopolymer transport system component